MEYSFVNYPLQSPLTVECKQLWNIINKKDKLWVRWIHGYYIKNADWRIAKIPNQAARVIKKILGAREYIAAMPNGEELMKQENFSIRKMYLAMRGSVEKVAWRHMICKNIAAPKCVFILWLAIWKRMATTDRLLKFGIRCDPVCCLCKKEEESMNHLFFVCDYSREVWQKLAAWCGVRLQVMNWEDELVYLQQQGSSKTGKQLMYRLLVASSVYHIWRERNERRFNAKFQTEESVIRQCQIMMVIRGRDNAKVQKLFLN